MPVPAPGTRKVGVMAEDSQRAAICVVVADDDDQNARLLVRILERGGYKRIEWTTDSAEVMPICERVHPDLLLLDVSMPSPNGFEILEELSRHEELDPVVVILTGHEHPSIERRGIELGAAAVVGKTASMDELLSRLDAVLRTSGRMPERRERSRKW
jgi:putative two-component system response regulator